MLVKVMADVVSEPEAILAVLAKAKGVCGWKNKDFYSVVRQAFVMNGHFLLLFEGKYVDNVGGDIEGDQLLVVEHLTDCLSAIEPGQPDSFLVEMHHLYLLSIVFSRLQAGQVAAIIGGPDASNFRFGGQEGGGDAVVGVLVLVVVPFGHEWR